MYTTIVSPADLERLRAEGADLVVFDCRARLGDPGWAAGAFAEGHLPGAQRLDLDADLAAPAGAGGRHPLPDRTALRDRIRHAGANDASQLVFYDDAGGAFAARAWWLCRWLGHRASAVLDGGLAAWQARVPDEGLDSGSAVSVTAGSFSERPPLTRRIDARGLLRRLEQPTLKLMDARTEARFRGEEEPIDPVAGHIPGAECRPFQRNLDDSGSFKAASALALELGPCPVDTVLYCGSGVTAAHNALAMVHAGQPEPLLYPGSWSEWIVDPERPRAP
ncbi:MAG: sulfurtransferase [Pseudomonadota bacterium]